MKKNFFLWVTVFAVGAMSSCSVDKVVDQAEARYIGFDPFANKVTRGLTNVQFGHSNFDVWGKYDAVNVFARKTVSWQDGSLSGSWTYQPLVPWVDGQTYEFAAIAPTQPTGVTYAYNYSNNLTTGSDPLNGTYSITGIEITQSNQTDYLTATPVKVVCNTASTSPVSFDFNHILSKIDFKFQPKTTSADNTHWLSDVKIDITSITLSSVATKNDYTAGVWGTATADGSFSVTLADNNSTTYEPSSAADPKVSQLTDKFSWLVVPQKNDETYSAETSSGRKLTIKFDVSTQDAAGNYTVKVLTDKEATIDITTDWNKNTHYTYTVYIGSNVLGADPYITFDVNSVQGWGGPEEGTVDVTPLTTKP